jgi:hypothetical protein
MRHRIVSPGPLPLCSPHAVRRRGRVARRWREWWGRRGREEGRIPVTAGTISAQGVLPTQTSSISSRTHLAGLSSEAAVKAA